jgi:UDP-glucuronate 4-epimerase
MSDGNQNILVTGVAGFIGFHTARSLLERGDKVIGVDNFSSYYDVSLKKERLKQITPHPGFTFYHEDIKDFEALKSIFSRHRVEKICNLAAQAGVRYSLQDPFSYQESNIRGFLNLLELARQYPVANFVFASSSSVYGDNKKLPFSVEDRVDRPISLYAVTKKSNELMAYAYHHLFGIPLTGLRYFTVYGPRQRPDMAFHKMFRAARTGGEFPLFGDGAQTRDFTFIDDAVEANISAMEQGAPGRAYNIGGGSRVSMLDVFEIAEKITGAPLPIKKAGEQKGDVRHTSADVSLAQKELGYAPAVSLEEGLAREWEWIKEIYS